MPLTTSRSRNCRLPVEITKSAGINRPITASVRFDEWTPADCALKSCSRCRSPPNKNEKPSTSSRFPRIEPVSDAFTTSISSSRIRKIAMTSSVTLPNVAFSRPPIRGPACSASSSVARPIVPASGTIAPAAVANVSSSLCSPKSASTDTGTSTSSHDVDGLTRTARNLPRRMPAELPPRESPHARGGRGAPVYGRAAEIAPAALAPRGSPGSRDSLRGGLTRPRLRSTPPCARRLRRPAAALPDGHPHRPEDRQTLRYRGGKKNLSQKIAVPRTSPTIPNTMATGARPRPRCRDAREAQDESQGCERECEDRQEAGQPNCHSDRPDDDGRSTDATAACGTARALVGQVLSARASWRMSQARTAHLMRTG